MNIFFVGLSGVGKTSLIDELVRIHSKYYIPPFLTTRPTRKDDSHVLSTHPSVFYRESDFLLRMEGNNVFYGYKNTDIDEQSVNLLYGGPAYLSQMKRLGKVILIQSDPIKGLRKRNQSLDQERIRINEQLSDLFYSKTSFIENIDLVFNHDFTDINKDAQILHKLIKKHIILEAQ